MTDPRYELVPRPLRGRHRPLVQAILNTVATGEAVRFTAAHSEMPTWRSTLSRLAKEHGVRVHVHRDGEHVIAWAEPIPERPTVEEEAERVL